jgi:N-methylhydantoinase A
VDVISRLAEKLGVDTFQMAEGILEVVNSNMIRALRVVSVEKGFDVRRFPLVAFGGAGPLHAGRLAQRLQIPRVVVPAFSSFFSAFGCLVADLRHDAVQTMLVELTPASAPGIERGLNGLKAEMLERLRHDAIHPAEVSWMFSVDLRYVGQRYELEVPIAQLPGPLDTERIRAEYHRLHAALYSYATDDPVECVNLRVRASVATSRPPLPRWNPTGGDPIRGHRRAYFRETGQVEVPIFDRARLGTPALPGPAIVADAWSTTVVYPQQQLRVDDHGNLWLENPAGRV